MSASNQSSEPLSIEQLRSMAAGDMPAESYLHDLMQTLASSDEELRAWASDALQSIESPPREWSVELARYCAHSQPAVVGWACKLLGRLGEAASAQQAAIVQVLQDHHEITTRQQAALALAEIPQLSTPTLAALQKATHSCDPRLQRVAQQALDSRERLQAETSD